ARFDRTSGARAPLRQALAAVNPQSAAAQRMEVADLQSQLASSDKAPALIVGINPGGVPWLNGAIPNYERWLGKRADRLSLFNGQVDWSDFTGSVAWQVSQSNWPAYVKGRRLAFAVSLMPRTECAYDSAKVRYYDCNFAGAIAGRFDAAYSAVAEALLGAGAGDAPIRVCPEHEGDWFPGNADQDRQCYVRA